MQGKKWICKKTRPDTAKALAFLKSAAKTASETSNSLLTSKISQTSDCIINCGCLVFPTSLRYGGIVNCFSLTLIVFSLSYDCDLIIALFTLQVAYRKLAKKLLETDFSPAQLTPEMTIAEQLRPLKNPAYQKQAKDLMHKYHLNVELPVSKRESFYYDCVHASEHNAWTSHEI